MALLLLKNSYFNCYVHIASLSVYTFPNKKWRRKIFCLQSWLPCIRGMCRWVSTTRGPPVCMGWPRLREPDLGGRGEPVGAGMDSEHMVTPPCELKPADRGFFQFLLGFAVTSCLLFYGPRGKPGLLLSLPRSPEQVFNCMLTPCQAQDGAVSKADLLPTVQWRDDVTYYLPVDWLLMCQGI